MPLNLWIAMRDSECRNVLASGSLDRDSLNLPAWCRYLPLKGSMTGALNTCNDIIVINKDYMEVDFSCTMQCKCLALVLDDPDIVDLFSAGKLTKSTTHNGYRLYDTPIDSAMCTTAVISCVIDVSLMSRLYYVG